MWRRISPHGRVVTVTCVGLASGVGLLILVLPQVLDMTPERWNLFIRAGLIGLPISAVVNFIMTYPTARPMLNYARKRTTPVDWTTEEFATIARSALRTPTVSALMAAFLWPGALGVTGIVFMRMRAFSLEEVGYIIMTGVIIGTANGVGFFFALRLVLIPMVEGIAAIVPLRDLGIGAFDLSIRAKFLLIFLAMTGAILAFIKVVDRGYYDQQIGSGVRTFIQYELERIDAELTQAAAESRAPNPSIIAPPPYEDAARNAGAVFALYHAPPEGETVQVIPPQAAWADAVRDIIGGNDRAGWRTLNTARHVGYLYNAHSELWLIATVHLPISVSLHWNVFIPMVVFVIATLVVAFLGARDLATPLDKLARSAERIADGDLEHKITVAAGHEVGRLGEAFENMVHGLVAQLARSNELVERLRDTGARLTIATLKIQEVTHTQSSGAVEQLAAIEESHSTSQEIAATADEIANTAQQVEEAAKSTADACLEGQTASQKAVLGMEDLRAQVHAIAEQMTRLTTNAHSIGEAVDLIAGIAERTNLLALNAALEAAGAGETGKRFTVVAHEIRRLADQTSDASNEIARLIHAIQDGSVETHAVTVSGEQAAGTAAELVRQVERALMNITASAEETRMAFEQITLTTRQQTSASAQMSDAIAGVMTNAEHVETGAHDIDKAARDLATLAGELRDMLETANENTPQGEATPRHSVEEAVEKTPPPVKPA